MSQRIQRRRYSPFGTVASCMRITARDELGRATPHLAVAFNAGVWGYIDLVGLREAICTGSSCPLVLTAYNEFEAEEDEDSLRSYGREPLCVDCGAKSASLARARGEKGYDAARAL